MGTNHSDRGGNLGAAEEENSGDENQMRLCLNRHEPYRWSFGCCRGPSGSGSQSLVWLLGTRPWTLNKPLIFDNLQCCPSRVRNRGNRVGGWLCQRLSRVHPESLAGDLRPAALAQYPSPAIPPELVHALRAESHRLAQRLGNRVGRSFLNDQTAVRSLEQGAQPSCSGSNDRPSVG